MQVGTSDASGFCLSAGESRLLVVGASLVRHENELSAMLVAGEQPPYPSDELVSTLKQHGEVTKGHEGIAPRPDLGIKNRYLPGLPGFARVILLVRFDIQKKEYDVQYVNLDVGDSYLVLTDDESALSEEASPEFRETYRQQTLKELDRYSELFSAAAALIYLPLAFVDRTDRVQETRFVTELHATRDNKHIRNAIRELGEEEITFSRSVRCLTPFCSRDTIERRCVDPPAMEFASTGYWRSIPPGEIGEDKDGSPIVGRTWVQRLESWSARSPRSFLLQRTRDLPEGPNAGSIYIMRSPAHEVDVYKVGFTKRSVEDRSSELSSATGVPLPFGVLARWDVQDCIAVEREVHRRLNERRLTSRREFFRSSLSEIVATIECVIAELEEGAREPG